MHGLTLHNESIYTHNHNEYLLLYKEAEILLVCFGRIFSSPEVVTYHSCNTGTSDLLNMSGPPTCAKHIRQITHACVANMIYNIVAIKLAIHSSWECYNYCAMNIL